MGKVEEIRQPVPYGTPDQTPAQYHELHRMYGHETDGRCWMCFPPRVTTPEEERAMDVIVKPATVWRHLCQECWQAAKPDEYLPEQAFDYGTCEECHQEAILLYSLRRQVGSHV